MPTRKLMTGAHIVRSTIAHIMRVPQSYVRCYIQVSSRVQQQQHLRHQHMLLIDAAAVVLQQLVVAAVRLFFIMLQYTFMLYIYNVLWLQ
jgi:hypothetical protein